MSQGFLLAKINNNKFYYLYWNFCAMRDTKKVNRLTWSGRSNADSEEKRGSRQYLTEAEWYGIRLPISKFNSPQTELCASNRADRIRIEQFIIEKMNRIANHPHTYRFWSLLFSSMVRYLPCCAANVYSSMDANKLINRISCSALLRSHLEWLMPSIGEYVREHTHAERVIIL